MTRNSKIFFHGLSDMGRQRTNNEDAYIAEQLDSNSVLAVAIDGVGGYEGGEIAAEIAQREIPKYLHDFRNGDRLELLKQAVIAANNAIYDRRQVDTARPNMSCVLTSVIVDIERKVIDMVHVGDTRLYQFNAGVLTKLSHDHSLVGYREEIGDLTEEQAMHHPQRNVISRDVGSDMHEVEDRDFLEATEFPLMPNSILLLCSDGLTDLVTSNQIISVLKLDTSLEEKTQMLIDLANEAGGKDNITVVLVEYQSDATQVNITPVLPDSVEEQHPLAEETSVKTEEKQSDSLLTKTQFRTLIIINVIIGVIVVIVVALCLYLFVFNGENVHNEYETEPPQTMLHDSVDVQQPQAGGISSVVDNVVENPNDSSYTVNRNDSIQ